jgi:hypothetical protein
MVAKESHVHYRSRSIRGAGSEGTPQAVGKRDQGLVKQFQESL